MLSVHYWGKLQFLEAALTPRARFQVTHFTLRAAHRQWPLPAEAPWGPNKTTPIIVLKWRLPLGYWPCILCKQGGCVQQPRQLYLQEGSHRRHTGTAVGLLSRSCACAWVS